MESFRDLVESMEKEPVACAKREPPDLEEAVASDKRLYGISHPLYEKNASAGRILIAKTRDDVGNESFLLWNKLGRKRIQSAERPSFKNMDLTSVSALGHSDFQQNQSKVQERSNKILSARQLLSMGPSRGTLSTQQSVLESFRGPKPHRDDSGKTDTLLKSRKVPDLLETSQAYRCQQLQQSPAGSAAALSRRHNPQRPFGCDQCPSRFNQLVHLQIHQRTHTGEKPFLCHLCDARFSRKDRLRSHHRIHTGEKPYACPHCDTSFRDTTTLKEHLKRHTEEKPYICRLCKASFANLTTFTTHWRMHKARTVT